MGNKGDEGNNSRVLYCRKCGNKLKAESKFCSVCGTAVEYMGENKRDRQKHKSRKIQIIIASVCIIAVCIGIIIFVKMNEDKIDKDMYSWKTSVTYDEYGEIIRTSTAEVQGNIVTELCYDADGKEESKIVYKFKGDGNLVEETLYDLESGKYVVSSKKERTYNRAGKLVTESYCWPGENGLERHLLDKYSYNQDGGLTEVVCYSKGTSETVRYKIKDNGDKIEWKLDEGGRDFIYTYYYDEKNHLIEKKCLDEGTQLLDILWEYNTNGKLVKEKIFGEDTDVLEEYTEYRY